METMKTILDEHCAVSRNEGTLKLGCTTAVGTIDRKLSSTLEVAEHSTVSPLSVSISRL